MCLQPRAASRISRRGHSRSSPRYACRTVSFCMIASARPRRAAGRRAAPRSAGRGRSQLPCDARPSAPSCPRSRAPTRSARRAPARPPSTRRPSARRAGERACPRPAASRARACLVSVRDHPGGHAHGPSRLARSPRSRVQPRPGRRSPAARSSSSRPSQPPPTAARSRAPKAAGSVRDLERAADARRCSPIGRLLRNVDAVELDGTARRPAQAGDEVEECRLPRPVRADHGKQLALEDLELDIGDDRGAADVESEHPRGEDWRCGHASKLPSGLISRASARRAARCRTSTPYRARWRSAGRSPP